VQDLANRWLCRSGCVFGGEDYACREYKREFYNVPNISTAKRFYLYIDSMNVQVHSVVFIGKEHW